MLLLVNSNNVVESERASKSQKGTAVWDLEDTMRTNRLLFVYKSNYQQVRAEIYTVHVCHQGGVCQLSFYSVTGNLLPVSCATIGGGSVRLKLDSLQMSSLASTCRRLDSRTGSHHQSSTGFKRNACNADPILLDHTL